MPPLEGEEQRQQFWEGLSSRSSGGAIKGGEAALALGAAGGGRIFLVSMGTEGS
jgi:hypothetical protein